MILKDFKSNFKKELTAIYPNTEIDSFFFLLMEEYMGLQRIETVLKSEINIPENILSDLKNATNKLKNEEPIQYIIGETEFFGLPFKVNKHTLIPRPETEELVEWVLNEVEMLNLKKDKSISILDIGTGTGCIPIALAKRLPKAAISAIDVSKEALKVAKENAALNQVNIDFIELDILKTRHLPKEFDIIISNPPYVRELEKKEIQNNVLQNEPHLALFVSNNNPLIFYEKIAELARKDLSEKGILFFEINQYLGLETVNMLKTKGFDHIELRKDIFKNDRKVKALFNI